MNLLDVISELGTEEQCCAFLEAMRWSDGVRCAVCGCDRISHITRRTTGKNVRKNLYQCLEPTCLQQFSVTSGTIFHDTRVPLTKWFLAIQLVMESKKGMSAMQLKRVLWGDHKGSYQTCWHMMHRIREAMISGNFMLSGTVEIDESYIGTAGKGKRGRSKGGTKATIIGLRQRGGDLKMIHIPDVKAQTIGEVVEANVSDAVELIVTDEFRSYPLALKRYPGKHKAINHSAGLFVVGDKREVHTNSIESAFSLFKRGVMGNFHRVSVKHLSRYLNEFSYRFNQRKAEDRFTEMIRMTGKASPLPYRKLTADLVKF